MNNKSPQEIAIEHIRIAAGMLENPAELKAEIEIEISKSTNEDVIRLLKDFLDDL